MDDTVERILDEIRDLVADALDEGADTFDIEEAVGEGIYLVFKRHVYVDIHG